MPTIIPDPKSSSPVMELNARIIAAAAVLGDYKAEVASAPVTRPPGRQWMLRLASVLEDLVTALDNPVGASEEDDLDGLEPYCAECGAWIGMFPGMDGWRHFRGAGTASSPVELFNACHAPVEAWCRPAVLPPADTAVLGQALDDVQAYRRERAEAYCYECAQHPAGACETHVDDLDQADAYAGLGRQLRQEDGR
jgi:hypothetical protein